MAYFFSSRRTFTPPDHWLVTSQVDMATFIDAAVYVFFRLLDHNQNLTIRINLTSTAQKSER